MKVILIKMLVLTGLIGIIIASIFRTPEISRKELMEKEIQEVNRKKKEYTERVRENLMNELENLRKDNDYKSIKDSTSDILKYFLSSETYTFEAENLINSNKNAKYGFGISLTDTSKGIYDIIDTSPFGKGEIVKYCKATGDDAKLNEGVILSKPVMLKEGNFSDFDMWDKDYQYFYIFSPRIRIDRNFTTDLRNADVPVCLITITDSYGDTVFVSNLHVKNFFDSESFKYDGSYKSEYDELVFRHSLRFPGKRMIKTSKKGNKYMNMEIFYYGYCDMWIDNIRIENEIANSFFTKQDASVINMLEKLTGKSYSKQ